MASFCQYLCKLDDSLEKFLQNDLSSEELSFSTDSSDVCAWFAIYNNSIVGLLDKYGFSEHDKFCLHLSFDELYSNAVIHGNLAGDIASYESRHIPVPVDVESNKNKLINIDFVINDDLFALGISDEGKGPSEDLVCLPNSNECGGRGRYLVKKSVDKFYCDLSLGEYCVSVVKFKSNKDNV